jgi:stringent starvation protein B
MDQFPTEKERANRALVESYLAKSMTTIVVDTKEANVVLPGHLMGESKAILNLSWQFERPMSIDHKGITVDLGFNGVTFTCVIPWNSVTHVLCEHEKEVEGKKYTVLDEVAEMGPEDVEMAKRIGRRREAKRAKELRDRLVAEARRGKPIHVGAKAKEVELPPTTRPNENGEKAPEVAGKVALDAEWLKVRGWKLETLSLPGQEPGWSPNWNTALRFSFEQAVTQQLFLDNVTQSNMIREFRFALGEAIGNIEVESFSLWIQTNSSIEIARSEEVAKFLFDGKIDTPYGDMPDPKAPDRDN